MGILKNNKTIKTLLIITLILLVVFTARYYIYNPTNNATEVIINNNTLILADGNIYIHDLITTQKIANYTIIKNPPTTLKEKKFENKYTYYKTTDNNKGTFNLYFQYKKKWIKATITIPRPDPKTQTSNITLKSKGEELEDTIFWNIY